MADSLTPTLKCRVDLRDTLKKFELKSESGTPNSSSLSKNQCRSFFAPAETLSASS